MPPKKSGGMMYAPLNEAYTMPNINPLSMDIKDDKLYEMSSFASGGAKKPTKKPVAKKQTKKPTGKKPAKK
tara:strand:+ start:1549 stop:1761 length:213 start_codon:yes stop_codon:yes gene_type:complete